MRHAVVDNCIAAFKFVPNWFVTYEIFKSLILLCTEMMIYSFLMKILIMSHFVLMKWVF